MKTLKIFFFIAAFAITGHAQIYIPDTVNTQPVTELQSVQTSSNTFIAALMTNINYPAMVIFRSTDNGATWDSVFYYGADSEFNGTPDPAITTDGMGNIYVATMRTQPNSGGFVANMWLFKSTDDGLTWNLASKPYAGNDFSDYPSIAALGNGLIYHSYTHYTPDTSYITFKRSFDGGNTWADSSFFVTMPPTYNSYDAIGSDLGWSFGNKLSLSYGDYNNPLIYYTSSNDSGATWAPVQNIPIAPAGTYIVTKVVSNVNFSYLGIIAHKPHTTTDIYYLYSLDTGNTWQYQTISSNSAYCEGAIDNTGNVHLVYNEVMGATSRLCYRYSVDEGQTFTSVMTLLSWAAASLTSGEYQSLVLGNDGLFHLTYVDWNNLGTAKHLIFAPLLASIYEANPLTHAPRIFPNPIRDYLNLESDATNKGATYDLVNLQGEIIMSGKVSLPKTSIDVASLKSGIFLMRITCGNIIYVQKIVKE